MKITIGKNDGPVMDRYGTDVLAGAGRRKPRSVEHPVELGMVVEDAQTGYVGAVVRVEHGCVDLEDRRGKTRNFPLGPGFLLEGRPVILTAPRRAAPAAAARTASGSVAVSGQRARVARASRIYVEGRHDARHLGFPPTGPATSDIHTFGRRGQRRPSAGACIPAPRVNTTTRHADQPS
ncbi:hypothetical protein Mkiyose1384_52350 [Mycobacterium kiyosense]|nr:hypothetical protein Mkiyose1383_52260 [Mycobacterium kiyosense]GLD15006.1 hypothetical protein Mkiyose1384_52350 [Mycobacterium kiyosense]GLD21129.1 hypothetical protein Mkiyose1385_52280 [Mycobacterium kiyosense]GLD27321.1 hypothetical protein Mkiyose1386_53140 [Mycobacterium kiyosense]